MAAGGPRQGVTATSGTSFRRHYSFRVRRGLRHEEKVARIARDLTRHRGGRPVSLRKKATSHQVPKARDAKYTDDLIDVSDLNDILRIDPAARVCVAESGVTFVDLVTATLRHGLVPLIVPELKTITIGGAVSGCSVESSSFKHGGFHDTCLEYEVVTATGDVLTCRPDNEHALMFQMMHGTFGTLGVLTKLTFRLAPAKPFVRVDYEHHATLDSFERSVLRHFREQDVDFVDGFVHAPGQLVVNAGTFVDEAPYANRYDWMKVYCRSTRERREDYLRTAHYFFRYDHGVTNVHPSSFLGRLVLGRFFGSSQLLRLAEQLNPFLPVKRPTVTVDVFLPFSRAGAFLDWYSRTLAHFPLWCVPYRRVRDYEWLSSGFYRGLDDPLFLDVAIYGLKQPRGAPNYYKLIEDELMRLGGMKTLISHNYYSEDDFWKVWNRDNYARVKAVADPRNVFRDLYAKTCRAAMGQLG
jgi:FAD/FMN-containing dehydrogenase